MDVRIAQELMFNAGFYAGDIDGDHGPKTDRAISLVETRYGHNWRAWPPERRLVASAQTLLDKGGYEPGAIDGKYGPNTREAVNSWRTQVVTGKPVVLDRVPTPTYSPSEQQALFPRQSDMASFYGAPGNPKCTTGKVVLPFAFYLAWNRGEKISSFSCHERCAGVFQSAFHEAARHYGEEEYRRLRLDLWGGCYNYRKMRGGTGWSTHAYGAAFDLDPDMNQLRWGRDRASFARPEYEPFINICESVGLVSLGRAANMDWMHFQAARL